MSAGEQDSSDFTAHRGTESPTAPPVSSELLKRATPTPPAEPHLHPEGSGAASKEAIPADGELEHASPVVVPASLNANKTAEAVKEVRDEK